MSIRSLLTGLVVLASIGAIANAELIDNFDDNISTVRL
jgi:hypothetical protein